MSVTTTSSRSSSCLRISFTHRQPVYHYHHPLTASLAPFVQQRSRSGPSMSSITATTPVNATMDNDTLYMPRVIRPHDATAQPTRSCLRPPQDALLPAIATTATSIIKMEEEHEEDINEQACIMGRAGSTPHPWEKIPSTQKECDRNSYSDTMDTAASSSYDGEDCNYPLALSSPILITSAPSSMLVNPPPPSLSPRHSFTLKPRPSTGQHCRRHRRVTPLVIHYPATKQYSPQKGAARSDMIRDDDICDTSTSSSSSEEEGEDDEEDGEENVKGGDLNEANDATLPTWLSRLVDSLSRRANRSSKKSSSSSFPPSTPRPRRPIILVIVP